MTGLRLLRHQIRTVSCLRRIFRRAICLATQGWSPTEIGRDQVVRVIRESGNKGVHYHQTRKSCCRRCSRQLPRLRRTAGPMVLCAAVIAGRSASVSYAPPGSRNSARFPRPARSATPDNAVAEIVNGAYKNRAGVAVQIASLKAEKLGYIILLSMKP